MKTLPSDRDNILDYLDRISEVIHTLEDYCIFNIENLIKYLYSAKIRNKKVFICGNGGSSSVASHIAQDLFKMCDIKAFSLTDNTSLITAISNDVNYNKIFEYQLNTLASKGDILITLSGSGSSGNILNALKWANKNGLITITLVGTNGGKVLKSKNKLDLIIHIEEDMQKSEDMFLVIFHIVLQVIYKKYIIK